MAKIGVFGGCFNPIHKGHIALAVNAYQALHLDKVLLIPSAISTHKNNSITISENDRLDLCRIAAKDYPYIEVSDMEIQRGGISYSYQTLEQLSQSGDELVLIVGGDMFLTLANWMNSQTIAALATICTAPRSKGQLKLLQDKSTELQNKGFKTTVLSLPVFDISSTQLRELISNGADTTTYLDSFVSEVIKTKGLYTLRVNKLVLNYQQALDIIKTRLGNKRLNHSIEVAKTSKQLAQMYGGDLEQAEQTGLLHDIMKDATLDEQLQWAQKSVIIIDNAEKENSELWHAPAGEAYLRTYYNLQDEVLLKAVRFHTTGRAGMSQLEKIIYLADIISADRSFDGINKIRKAAMIGLDEGVFAGLKSTLEKLKRDGDRIHPRGIEAYQELLLQRERDKKNGE